MQGPKAGKACRENIPPEFIFLGGLTGVADRFPPRRATDESK
jgi:hypothetical protein